MPTEKTLISQSSLLPHVFPCVRTFYFQSTYPSTCSQMLCLLQMPFNFSRSSTWPTVGVPANILNHIYTFIISNYLQGYSATRTCIYITIFISNSALIYLASYEPRCEKTGLQGFPPGPTTIGLYSHRIWLDP